MKSTVRVILVMASSFMMVGNLHGNPNTFIASVLFFMANVISLVGNWIKDRKSKEIK